MLELKITDEHRWLQRLVGKWKSQPDGEPGGMWNETVEKVGEVFVSIDARGDMPDGSPGRTLMTIGYDPERKVFVGSFAGSMMTHHWVYEGSLNESGTVLTLDTEGPEWVHGTMVRFRDIIEFDGGNQRIFRSEMRQEDGSWKEIMRTTFVRD